MLRRWTVAGVSVALLVSFMGLASASPALASQPVTLANVNVRSGPGESNGLLGTLPNNTPVSIYCFVAGQPVSGPYGTEDLWDALTNGGYVPDALIYTGSNSAVVPACPSSQFGVGNYPVAWTGGGNAQAYAGASNGSSPIGSGIPDGQVVTVTCETSGQTLTDSAGFTSNLWDKLASGGYVSNVYLDTQVNGPTPGLSACSSAPPPPPSTGPISPVTSRVWAGYVGVAQGVTAVQSTWKVPKVVTCNGSSSSNVFIWDGIDGKENSPYLVQAGTAAQCNKGKSVYFAWWQTNPRTTFNLAGYVNPGDTVTVDIRYHPGPATYFVIALTVNGKLLFTQEKNVPNEPRSQAECVVEAPVDTNKKVSALTQFEPATFTDCRITAASATSQQIGRGSINGVSAARYTMTNGGRVLASVGNPGGGGVPWTVTWKHLS
jgi:hypothetical protein